MKRTAYIYSTIIVVSLSMLITVLPKKLHEGDSAPRFQLNNAQGKRFSLAEALQQHRYVILVFYPQDNTPGCTQQACRIRDLYPQLPPEIAIVGISGDTAESHQAFAAAHALPFPLLIDHNNTVRSAYGAYKLIFVPDRVTFIVDQRGIIVKKYAGLFSVNQHIALIKEFISQQNA